MGQTTSQNARRLGLVLKNRTYSCDHDCTAKQWRETISRRHINCITASGRILSGRVCGVSCGDLATLSERAHSAGRCRTTSLRIIRISARIRVLRRDGIVQADSIPSQHNANPKDDQTLGYLIRVCVVPQNIKQARHPRGQDSGLFHSDHKSVRARRIDKFGLFLTTI